MPLYDFERVDKPKIKDSFFFSMKDCPRVSETFTDAEGVVWKRVFTLPNAGVDTKIDHNSVQDFVTKTGNKKGSYGDLLDASKELSEKRAKERDGVDPVQKKFFDNYKKTRHGIEHLSEKKNRKVDKKNFTISYN